MSDWFILNDISSESGILWRDAMKTGTFVRDTVFRLIGRAENIPPITLDTSHPLGIDLPGADSNATPTADFLIHATILDTS